MNDAQHAGAGRDPSGQSSTRSMNRLAATVRILVAVATVLTVVLMVWFMRRGNATAAAGDFDKSVAVIPFEVATDDSASAAVAERIAGDVTAALSTASGLRLADRVPAAKFAGSSGTVQSIGTALNVSTVLDGTVILDGDRVRVTAELSNARNAVVLWAQKYDRDVRTVRTIVDDIARAIAAQLQVTLGSNDTARQ